MADIGTGQWAQERVSPRLTRLDRLPRSARYKCSGPQELAEPSVTALGCQRWRRKAEDRQPYEAQTGPIRRASSIQPFWTYRQVTVSIVFP